MKVLTRTQIREADRFTIEQEGVPSINLMERAARAFTDAFTARYDAAHPVAVVAGPGNNGGDGLAIARMLAEAGYSVRVFMLASERYSPDFQVNLQRLQALLPAYQIAAWAQPSDWEGTTVRPGEVWIDALFGTGLTRPLTEQPAALVQWLNGRNVPVVSVDIPSGLYCDDPNAPDDPVVRSGLTISFQSPKRAFFMEENAAYVPRFEVVDIGLSRRFLATVDTPFFYLTAADTRRLVPPRPLFAHKGMMGHLLAVGGKKGMMGAAVLMAQAALRSGVGKLTLRVPAVGYSIVQQAVPEALCAPDPHPEVNTALPDGKPSAYAVGPGIGTDAATGAVVEAVLRSEVPAVLDADALNLLAAHPQWRRLLSERHVLTPHPGEFRRLAGDFSHSVEKWEKLREFARRHHTHVVLKGRYSAVADPQGRITFNSTGNPGMATGGAGDVLTGIIGALLARRMPPDEAALLGTYLHGLAGDLAAERLGQEALIASDIIAALPDAWQLTQPASFRTTLSEQ